jgi:hypothetical protein
VERDESSDRRFLCRGGLHPDLPSCAGCVLCSDLIYSSLPQRLPKSARLRKSDADSLLVVLAVL